MTEEKKTINENQKHLEEKVEDKKEKADKQSISPSYINNPIAHAHIVDIDTRVSTPSEDDLINVKKWSDEKNKT